MLNSDPLDMKQGCMYVNMQNINNKVKNQCIVFYSSAQ